MPRTSVNLLDPLQGRRWLQLLTPDPDCGFRLKPNLNLPARFLGFSLNSNRFGLRGPCDDRGQGVVFGTSFAMGIAVNNGENWWDLALPTSGWMNLGLAVGFREWENLLGRYYRGSFDRAWLLYHPNFWVHCRMYERWRQSGTDVFRALRWRRSLPWCVYLKFRRAYRRPKQLQSGRLIEVHSDGGPFEIDTEYVGMDFDKQSELFERNLEILSRMLSRFRQVTMVRLRVKPELVPDNVANQRLRRTCSVYDQWYEATRSGLHQRVSLDILEGPPMKLPDYLPCDAHWNARGNQCFGEWMRPKISTQS
ncbi:MAG: hypothetical protein JNL10_17025 [Verrucomicrobiales bacterium]|nr:hypothetical protein [Verrucomicrobiales bacterium]